MKVRFNSGKLAKNKEGVQMNLKQETINVLEQHGLSVDDIEWIGTREYTIPFDRELSVLDVEYYDGFGGQEIAWDLVVVGKDFWLERDEYDGSEWWEFKTMPTKPNELRNYTKVNGGIWNSLSENNKRG